MVFPFLPMLIGIPAGKLFGELYDAVKNAIKTTIAFKSELEDIESILEPLVPLVRQIDQFNQELDRPREEAGKLMDIMAKGKDLVAECSKVEKYDLLKKKKYATKLRELKRSLESYIQIDVQAQQARDGKETLFEVKLLSNQIKKFSTDGAASTSKSSIAVGSRVYGVGGWLKGICSPPELKVDPVGLEIPLRELKRRVLQDAAPMVVLSAAGGCGKTTLATAFCHDLEVKDKFGENIFFITVSKSPSLLNIVKGLFQHIDSPVPDCGSEEDAVIQLEFLIKKLDQRHVLLVLDDVWPSSETLLDKLRFRIQSYQILVTSRSEFPRFGSTYKLPTLNVTDAMTLFSQSAFLPDGKSYQPDKDLVDKIVESCKGFPLLISVIGKSVCGKSAAEWRKRGKESAKASSILGNSEVLKCLQSSVDALDDEPVVKECFMDLGSFPEDQRIPAATLIDMWAELHRLDEDNVISNLYELARRSLLDILITRKYADEDDSSYDEHFISQHDLLRELAILQSTKVPIPSRERIFINVHENLYPKWCGKQIEPFNCAKLLSINTDERFASSWINIQAPEVQALVLNFQSKVYKLPEFMQAMEKLGVLAIASSFYPAELGNFHLLSSLSNLTRLRLERAIIPSVLFASMQLSKLEKISLVMCNIGQAFRESNDQLAAAFPNLTEMNIEYCNDLVALPNGICDLFQMNKLSITNCHKLTALPGQLGNLVNLEVLRLNSCIHLAELPGTVGSLHNLEVLDLSDCLSLKSLPQQIEGLHSLRKLRMIDCSGCQLPSSARNLVNLREVISDEETAASWKLFKPDLRDLTIKVHKDTNLNWLGGFS